MKLLKECSNDASRNYIEVLNEKLMLSLSHPIKLKNCRSLQIQKIKHGVYVSHL